MPTKQLKEDLRASFEESIKEYELNQKLESLNEKFSKNLEKCYLQFKEENALLILKDYVDKRLMLLEQKIADLIDAKLK